MAFKRGPELINDAPDRPYYFILDSILVIIPKTCLIYQIATVVLSHSKPGVFGGHQCLGQSPTLPGR